MAGWPPKKNAAFTWAFVIRDNVGDLVSGAAGLDAEVSIDLGAFTNIVAAVTDEGQGFYSVALTAAEFNGDVLMLQCKTSTTDAKTAAVVIYTSVRQIDDVLSEAVAELAAVPGATPTITEMIQFVYQYFKLPRTGSGSSAQEIMFMADGLTRLANALLESDGTDFTRREFLAP